ncbi:hypothetical protein F5X96DRAFT_666169 [Biscogniauxia mediterranea]|nr:hypothetical protein F5X96DRAFT_666169 [Biscogniauxia mediterranea]
MPYPRHEVELQRRAFRDCTHALRHPKELPGLMRGSWQQTCDYYAGRDVADLERDEIIELLAWTRRMTMKLSALSFVLGAMLVLLVMVMVSDASEEELVLSRHFISNSPTSNSWRRGFEANSWTATISRGGRLTIRHHAVLYNYIRHCPWRYV